MPLKDKFFKSGESVISPAYVFWCKAIQSTSQQLEEPLTDSNIHSAVNLWVAGGTNRINAEALYGGHISNWDVHRIHHIFGARALARRDRGRSGPGLRLGTNVPHAVH